MRSLLLTISVLFLSLSFFAQTQSLQSIEAASNRQKNLELGRKAFAEKFGCSYDDLLQKQHQDPVKAKAYYDNQMAISRYVEKNRARLESHKAGVLTVPVVFHILHLGEAVGTGSNIPDDQILSSVEGMNRDFRRTSADGGIAQGAGPDSEIEFCLASKDPSGNPHSGINRINANGMFNYETMGIDEDVNGSNLKNLSKWSTNDYVNIWIVREINDQGDFATWSGGTLGYAYRVTGGSTVNPNTNPAGNQNDGIVIINFALGNDPNDENTDWNIRYNLNRTLTHEMGHHLNLPHTFQDGCSPESDCLTEGDFVCDTPPAEQNFNACANPVNSCGVTQQVANYMDYSGENCQNMFSAGQIVRMRAVLEGFSRSSLTTSNKCSLAPPIANFAASTVKPCLNATVDFENQTSNQVDTYAWSITPGTFSYVGGTTASSRDIQVEFTAAGLYTVSLVATNTAGTDTETKTNYIDAGTGLALPFTEDWENSATYSNWAVSNADDDITWAITTVGGNTPGDKAIYVNNLEYEAADGAEEKDNLFSPVFDFTGYSSATLTFDQAYARYDDTYQDSLAVYVSVDCGDTYTKAAFYKDNNLRTRADVSTAFTPSTANDWCGAGGFAECIEIDLTPYVGNSSVRIAWQNISNWGNNLYIDNINITGTTGSAAPVAQFQVSESEVCPDVTTNLTDQSTNTPTSWIWSASPSTGVVFSPSNTAQNPSISFSNAGTYDISLVVSNSGGTDTETKSKIISVIDQALPAISITADKTTICDGDLISFSSTTTASGTKTIEWFINGGTTTEFGNNYTSTTLSTGDVVTATIKDVGACVTNNDISNEITLTVNPLPTKPSILYNANTLTSSVSATTYIWYKDGSIIDNGTNQAITFQGDGDYKLMIKDANGCENESDIASLTNITAIVNSTVEIYPNPAKNTVTISGIPSTSTIKMFDVLGKELILDKAVVNNHLQLDVSGFAKGTYLLQVNDAVHRLVIMD